MVPRTKTFGGTRIDWALYSALFISIVLAFLATRVYAQTATSTLVGLVTDSSNAIVPEAKITVTNLGTGISRVTATNTNGEYTVPFLDVGLYKITAEKTGFQTVTLQKVSLAYEQTVREDISLAVGAVSQQVTVEAAA